MRRAAVSWGGQKLRSHFATKKYGISQAENEDLIRKRLDRQNQTVGGWLYYNDAGSFLTKKEADIALAKKRGYYYEPPPEPKYRRPFVPKYKIYSTADAAREIRAQEKRKQWLTGFLAKKRMKALRIRNAKRQQRSFLLRQISKHCPDCNVEELQSVSTHNLQNYLRNLMVMSRSKFKRRNVFLNKLSEG